MPLTGAQEGVWYGQRLDPASPAYNTAEYVEIHGPVDPALFERSLRLAIGEIDALNVRFGQEQGAGDDAGGGPGPPRTATGRTRSSSRRTGRCTASTWPGRPTRAPPPRSGCAPTSPAPYGPRRARCSPRR
ncbi:hypothetical protein GEV43_44080 [Actinomadura sp. J1-007]|uniref:condensation domain-containing protein n=1 Tax=Actinomadura sp. J1-007 TaxID=2661913 RepID=UPI0013234C15|nr:condensation domain-containing protein [Actinomadura sp. J1-007]MWK40249.1 hypothetical protein [Actinomadura sp. J1-007]